MDLLIVIPAAFLLVLSLRTIVTTPLTLWRDQTEAVGDVATGQSIPLSRHFSPRELIREHGRNKYQKSVAPDFSYSHTSRIAPEDPLLDLYQLRC